VFIQESIINWVRYCLSAIVAVPAAVIVTMVLAPFWRWFESASTIESYGHSGPATWCYLASYILILIVGVLAALINNEKEE